MCAVLAEAFSTQWPRRRRATLSKSRWGWEKMSICWNDPDDVSDNGRMSSIAAPTAATSNYHSITFFHP
jgi:hypothetical protein